MLYCDLGIRLAATPWLLVKALLQQLWSAGAGLCLPGMPCRPSLFALTFTLYIFPGR